MNRLYSARRLRNQIAMALSLAATLFGLGWLVLILGALLWQGFSGLSFAVFTEMTPPPGSAGGLLNPIAGSLILTVLAVIIGTPIGILAGTYMAEYGRYDRLTTVVRFINDILLSAPSIVVGLFIYEVMVAPMGHFSGLAGAVALAVIVIPVVVRTTEDMLLLVANPLREAATALGMPRAVVIRQVCTAPPAPACSPACCSRLRASAAKPRRCFLRRSTISSGALISMLRSRACRWSSSSSPSRPTPTGKSSPGPAR